MDFVILYLILGLLIPLTIPKEGVVTTEGKINWSLPLSLSFIATIFIRGTAFNTGVDYEYYYTYYRNVVLGIYDSWGEHTEIGYKVLVHILSAINSSPFLFFILSSFLVIYSIFLLSSYYGKASRYIMLLWPVFMHNLSFNLYRQYIAISLLYLAFLFFNKKKMRLCYTLVALTPLFHLSSVAIIVLFLLIYKMTKYKIDKRIFYGIIVLTSLASIALMTTFIQVFNLFGQYYYQFTGQLYTSEGLMDSMYGTSIAIIPNMICYCVWVYYGDKFCEKYESCRFLYYLFVFGLIIFPITRQEILQRLCLYFVASFPVFLGILSYYFRQIRKYPVFWLTIVFQFLYYLNNLNSLGMAFPYHFMEP